MKKRLAIFFIICLPLLGSSQALQQVPHCPSGEVYDMMVDKKGFIWIAHNLGISRFDGISFTSFSNPEQSSLSATDLIEDNYGRIWFHNFNGQIFYIKDDKMVLLKDYDFRSSFNYPRIALYGDELVASSYWGLFVCNLSTLKCRYEKINKMPTAEITSMCIINNLVLAYGGDKWYTYKKDDGLHYINDVPPEISKRIPSLIKLQPHTIKDTALMISNDEGVLYGLVFEDGKLKPAFKKSVGKYISTISILDNEAWINTKSLSVKIDETDSIKNYNLTAMAADKGGNKWYSSLSNGLLVNYSSSAWKNIKLKGMSGNDYIQCLQITGKGIVLSSRDGKIMMSASSKENYEDIFTLPPQSGVTSNIQKATADDYFIETSNTLYLLDPLKRHVDLLERNSTRDIIVNGRSAFIASSLGLLVKNIDDWKLKARGKSAVPISLKNDLFQETGDHIFLKKYLRCRAILIDSTSNSLLISYSDGLHRLHDKQIDTILYNGQPLYVSSMTHYGKRIYAGTFNAGLFAFDSAKITKIENETSSSDGIVKVKRCNNHIWIFRAHDIEVLDAEKGSFINLYPFPADVSDITDVEEDSTNIYLATHHGLYTLPLSAGTNIEKYDPTLLFVLVNNRDTLYNDGISMANTKNNLLFKLAIPLYKDAERLHFKYRLINGDASVGEDSIWYYTQDAQRDIQFNALKPGDYTVEIIAVKDNEVISNKPLLYHFTIMQPWFNTWWFYVVIMLSCISIVLAIYQYRLRQVFKIERIRRKISNDLHDDIGSTLSSINVYSQLAKSGSDNMEYINTIQTNAVSVINNLDDLVWNINPKNDTLENVINRMRLFALPLFSEKNIECAFKVSVENTSLLIAPNVRADMFMLFKEMVNNVIKHAACTVCSIYIIQKGKRLRLTVKDNGRSFNIKNINPHRNGLRIMGERVKDLKGRIDIHSAPGKGTEIRITCRL